MTPRRTISVFLYIPERKAIVLGVRSESQSHPFLLQATAHGSLQEGEDHADAIERELKEETTLDLVDIGSLTFLGELDAGHRVPELCSYYLSPLTEAGMKKLRPTEEVSRFTFLTKEGATDVVRWEDAETHDLDMTTHRVMFEDELQALLMAFALLEEHRWNPLGA